MVVHNSDYIIFKPINAKRHELSLDKFCIYKLANKVLVDGQNLTIKEVNQSLTQKYIDTFTIKRKVGFHANKVKTSN